MFTDKHDVFEIESVTAGIGGSEPITGLAPAHLIDGPTSKPVYGCHIAKSDNTENSEETENRVVNVNRSNAERGGWPYSPTRRDQYDLPTGNTTTEIYRLKEGIKAGVTIHIDFHYYADRDVSGTYERAAFKISMGSPLAPESKVFDIDQLVDTDFGGSNQGYAHVHLEYVHEYDTGTIIYASNPNDSVVRLIIADFSVMYEYDDKTYEWAVAPATFPLGDIYTYEDKNYLESDRYGGYINSASASHSIVDNLDYPIGGPYVYGLTHVSFDLTIYFGEDEPLEDYAWFRIARGVNTFVVSIGTKEPISNKHYDLYVYTGNEYLSKIGIDFPDSLVVSGRYGYSATNLMIQNPIPKHVVDHTNKWYIYHVDDEFYLRAKGGNTFSKIYEGANRHISRAWQFEKNLYIIDGKEMYIYEAGMTEMNVIGGDKAYIPTVTIAKEPSGGGQQYEALNMLQPGFYELFQGTEEDVEYQLSFSGLDATTCVVWTLNSSGDWVEREEGTYFTVDRVTGKITFANAPGVSPLTGEDNIKVLAYRTVDGYRDRVTKCTTGTLFGVGGAEDRLFLAGNPEYPNWDFFSGQYDPTYFPDTGYSTLGSEQSAIVGYAVINNYLATFKDGYDTSQVVFIREGDLIVNEETQLSDPAFKLINTLQGNGVISPYSFGYLQTEPIFLTKQGLYSITSQDITGEKYSQNRSFYIDGQLTKESNLKDAVAVVFKDQYYLALNNRMYILDGMQATRTDRAEPYATRQYAGFLCNNIPATCIWVDEDTLYFGTSDGRICYFYNDTEDINSYNDDGEPIYACWETPDLDGKLFYKNKTFRYFAVRLMRAAYTSAKIYAERLGVWSFIKEQRVIGKAFNFNHVDFTRFTFSIDESEKLLHSKLRVKKVDKARFRIENGNINEPFGLFDLALEYIESGNYKG